MSRAAGSRRGRQQAAWPQPLSRRSRPRAGAEPGHCAKHSRVSGTCALRRSVAQTRGGSGCRAWRPGARAFSVGGTLRCPHDPMMKPARMTEFGPLCTCGNPTYTRESGQKGKGEVRGSFLLDSEVQRCDIWDCCSHFHTGRQAEAWPHQLEAEVRQPQYMPPPAIVGPRTSRAPRQTWGELGRRSPEFYPDQRNPAPGIDCFLHRSSICSFIHSLIQCSPFEKRQIQERELGVGSMGRRQGQELPQELR